MENHPIPQDITGFQFKLIGNMTVKQFAYLAAGAILAWLVYSIPVPIAFKLALIPLFCGTGFALAFIPIEGRPMDVMFMQFLRALTTSTQFIYHKQGRQLEILWMAPHRQVIKQKSEHTPSSQQKLQAYLKTIQPASRNALDTKEAKNLNSVSSLLASTTIPAAKIPQGADITTQQNQVGNPLATIFSSLPSFQHAKLSSTQPPMPANQPIAHIPQQPSPPMVAFPPSLQKPGVIPHEPQQTQEAKPVRMVTVTIPQNPQPQKEDPFKKSEELQETLEQTAKTIEDQLASVKKEGQTKSDAQSQLAAHQRATELEKKLEETLLEQQKLRNQIMKLEQQLATQSQKVFIPSEAKELTQSQNVRKIAKSQQARTAGLPQVSDAVNVIAGIIKDPRGNILPSILVEVKDKDGNPVRAFKTNALGQFASATPLVNGVYTLAFEDPQKQHKFDVIEITADATVLPPIEVISIDAREELRQVLFTPKT